MNKMTGVFSVLMAMLPVWVNAQNDQAKVLTRTMNNKLQLTQEQVIVVGIINENYFRHLDQLLAGDSSGDKQISELKGKRRLELEKVLSEQQYEKWIWFVVKKQRKAEKRNKTSDSS